MLYNPFYIYDIGFLLSFISVGAILFLHPFLLADKPKYVQMMGLTVIIQVALLPVFSLFFHYFSLSAVLANLWIVPAISYFLGIGGVALLFSGFSTAAAQIVAGGGYSLILCVYFRCFAQPPKKAAVGATVCSDYFYSLHLAAAVRDA